MDMDNDDYDVSSDATDDDNDNIDVIDDYSGDTNVIDDCSDDNPDILDGLLGDEVADNLSDNTEEASISDFEAWSQDMNSLTPELNEMGISSELPESVMEGISDFEAWSQDMKDLAPELNEETLNALWEDPDTRSYQETELVDTALHPDFESQRSILVDTETGKAVQDEFGNFVDCPRNTKGSQRPDGMMVDDAGVHLREAKNYGNLYNLERNIKEQTEKRFEAFGENTDLTYVVAPRFTIEEAEKLQDYVENKLGVNLEWQHK